MRVGIVGAGTMGWVHAHSHREAGHEAVAIYDLRAEVAEKAAESVGAQAAGLPHLGGCHAGDCGHRGDDLG
ncbi:MAG: 3-hydroxyacyl-CoA dehydrogenase NAD-binding domain-containing protein [Firmicutes bacterium]|nr:3-hydroxyacyl-CoA dehydrogenase NAD-binding domain-containing protein [Bacillota bacterium]